MSIYIRTTLWLVAVGVIAACNIASLVNFDALSYNDVARIAIGLISTIAVQLVALLDIKNQPKE